MSERYKPVDKFEVAEALERLSCQIELVDTWDHSLDATTDVGHRGGCYYIFRTRLDIIKVVDTKYDVEDHASILMREYYMLKSLDHPYIVKVKGEPVIKERLLIVQFEPYCRIDLKDIWKRLSEEERITCLREIRATLYYLFKHNVAHRDLTPENIYFYNHHPMITDFQAAVYTNNKKVMFSESIDMIGESEKVVHCCGIQKVQSFKTLRKLLK